MVDILSFDVQSSIHDPCTRDELQRDSQTAPLTVPECPHHQASGVSSNGLSSFSKPKPAIFWGVSLVLQDEPIHVDTLAIISYYY